MNETKSSPWKKSSVANILRYKPSGVYFARVRIGGKLIRRSLDTTILEVAKPRLAELIKDERGKLDSHGRYEGGRMLFKDAAGIYIEKIRGDADLKPRTKEYREACLKAIRKTWPGIDEIDLRKISRKDCEDWAKRLRANGTRFRQKGAKKAHENISSTRFNNTVATLRHILDQAVETGARYANPAQKIKKAKVRQKQLQLPSRAQFAELVRIIEASGAAQAHDCADLVRFLALSGCRVGDETQNVRWHDIDWEKGELVVRGDPLTATKNWERRRVPMIPELVELLSRMRRERPGEPNDAVVLRVKECQRSIDRACKLLGILRFTHHDLRHLFATAAIEGGVDIPTVSRLLGHKDGGALAMRVYGHLRDEHAKAQVQKIKFNLAPPENIVSMPAANAS